MPDDNFALLNEPRRPWLNPEDVQGKFLILSAALHPDRVHNASSEEKAAAHERFATLNGACTCLRDPKQRLRHLIEIERGVKLDHIERLPSAAMDFYFRIGQLCREVDQFLVEKARASSPLLKVQLFQQAMNWTEKIQQFQGSLKKRRGELEMEMKALNPAWEAVAGIAATERPSVLPLDKLEQIYREFSYLARWAEQVQERIVQLSL